MPNDKDGHIRGKCTRLQDQCSLDQDLTSHVFSGAVRSVCGLGCAVRDHHFDEEVDADESRQDPSWMERREPRDVVERPG